MPKVMVSIDENSMTDLPRLVVDLRQAGLQVDEVLESLGTVTGSIARDSVDALMAVPGVAHVEWQRDIDLPTNPTNP